MASIVWLSPTPPARTGVATYSSAVLSGLRATRALAGHRLASPWPLPGTVFDLVGAANLPVYHVGNNAEFHADIYRLALRYPGLVVLHDLALDDLIRAFLDRGDPVGGRAEAEADAARERLVRARPDITGPLEVPWCAHLVRRARGVIVHSTFGREYLEAFGCRTPVFVVPHPVVQAPWSARRAQARAPKIRDRMGGRLVIGVLGDIGEPKRIDVVLAAAARLEAPIHVAVVGRTIPGYEIEEVVRASGIGYRVTVESDVSEADFYAWLEATDVVVNLRDPHRGEVSGTLMRAMAVGKPVIVQAEGSYLDLPQEAVVRIGRGPPDPRELAGALERLLAHPKLRWWIGDRARHHVEQLGRTHSTEMGYAGAIERTLALVRDPARSAVTRWARALSSVGAGERDAPLGERYAAAVAALAGAGVPGVGWYRDAV
ncbi:MAG TPA: glycosyltransferase [Actinomycetota bacterium]|nr:glycosyltransferase [Actinomycetota bacterium]